MTDKEKIAFLAKHWLRVNHLARRAGYATTLILAHAALESKWGTSDYARKGKNIFSITAGSSWTGAKIPSNVIAGLFFRKYRSWTKAVIDYLQVLKKHVAPTKDKVAFATILSSSDYIDPNNGDDRMTYRHNLIALSGEVERLLPEAQKRVLAKGCIIVVSLCVVFICLAIYFKKI